MEYNAKKVSLILTTYNCRENLLKTFKSIVKRSDKNFPIHSDEMNRVIGGLLLKNISNISVYGFSKKYHINDFHCFVMLEL